MSDPVLISIVGCVQAVVVTALGALVVKNNKDTQQSIQAVNNKVDELLKPKTAVLPPISVQTGYKKD